jgi:carbon-monoxide dehydrogenase medium subunit
MKFVEPTTVDEVIRILSEEEDARCLAGGATLVAMMNADLVDPSVLVSLRKVKALGGIQESGDRMRIGAMTRHAAIAAEKRLTGAMSVVRSAAEQIAHPAIRNMGTIGGAICHADPAADFPAALVAADAVIEAAGAKGKREIPVEEFFVDYLETSLEKGEIVTAVLLPRGPRGASGAHYKFSRVDGDYATVSISAVVAMEKEACRYVRIAVGSCGPRPVRVEAAEKRLLGTRLAPEDVAAAGEMLAEAADPVDDVRGSSEFRRLLIPRLLGRALHRAREGAHVG